MDEVVEKTCYLKVIFDSNVGKVKEIDLKLVLLIGYLKWKPEKVRVIPFFRSMEALSS